MTEENKQAATYDLAQLRAEIDQVDDQILDLFAQRMVIAGQIAASKRQTGKQVLDSSREQAILAGVRSKAPKGMEDYAASLFTTLMEMSRAYQHDLLDGESPLCEAVRQALAQAPSIFPSSASVAVQGTEGAFAQQACERVFKHPAITYFPTFEGVFSAVEQGRCPFGIVPLENSTAGSVNRVYDLMREHDFHIVRTVRVKVDHCLLVPHGTRLEDVTCIISHPQALAQCSGFLDGHPQIQADPVGNTAMAARQVAQASEPGLAAIASRNCAELYGLDVLVGDIQDEGANFTRFACIARDLIIYPGADRASFSLVTPHRPGALCQVLSRLAMMDVNVRKLESRPLAGRDFEFMFYFDIEQQAADPSFPETLAAVESLSEEFRYLGSYAEVN